MRPVSPRTEQCLPVRLSGVHTSLRTSRGQFAKLGGATTDFIQTKLSGRTIPGVTFGGSCTRKVPEGVLFGFGADCTGFPSATSPTCTSFPTSQVWGSMKEPSSTTQQGAEGDGPPAGAPACLPDDVTATTEEPQPPQNFALSAATTMTSEWG